MKERSVDDGRGKRKELGQLRRVGRLLRVVTRRKPEHHVEQQGACTGTGREQQEATERRRSWIISKMAGESQESGRLTVASNVYSIQSHGES